jgi:hypothetical protein
MAKRRIDPEAGKPALTSRENKMADGFVTSGGDATRAAAISDLRPEAARHFHLLPQPKEARSTG